MRKKIGATAFLLLFLMTTVIPMTGQAQTPVAEMVTASGTACATVAGSTSCGPLTAKFSPKGGPVSGYFEVSGQVSAGGVAFSYTSKINLAGTFEGGDGGKVSGVLSGSEVVSGLGTLNITGTRNWMRSLC